MTNPQTVTVILSDVNVSGILVATQLEIEIDVDDDGVFPYENGSYADDTIYLYTNDGEEADLDDGPLFHMAASIIINHIVEHRQDLIEEAWHSYCEDRAEQDAIAAYESGYSHRY